MGRKHWEKEKLLVKSNFSFSHSVFKRLVLQTHKNHSLEDIPSKHWTGRQFRPSFTLCSSLSPSRQFLLHVGITESPVTAKMHIHSHKIHVIMTKVCPVASKEEAKFLKTIVPSLH